MKMSLLAKGFDRIQRKELHLLEKAMLISAMFHAKQKDKGKMPYILHPVAVMNRVETIEEKIVAILHDVVEDSNGQVTEENLGEDGFTEVILSGIRSVTKVKGESYDQSLRRAWLVPIGRVVKKADLTENSNIDRIPVELRTEKILKNSAKYKRAIDIFEHADITWFWNEDKQEWIHQAA